MDTLTRTPAIWLRALDDPALRDLPYKIETNAYDQLVLSPHKPKHSLTQGRLYDLLHEHLGERPGLPVIELAVETSDGIKVPDVVWISNERLDQIPDDAPASPVMPEVCVEVLSRSNSAREMDGKRALYFAHGAVEVWLCDVDGTLRFFDEDGPLERSALAPSMPTKA